MWAFPWLTWVAPAGTATVFVLMARKLKACELMACELKACELMARELKAREPETRVQLYSTGAKPPAPAAVGYARRRGRGRR
ncbi:hypothetical protein GA0115245_105831 [Streptomyces sp. di188]|nr:hypothetical protein GA0115245_105831 [Streptomyces sp. di188]SCD49755.1 hypothetical protein GA0115238_111931 [Streptomyces sp. di50b]